MDLMAPTGPPVDKLAPTGLYVDSPTLADPPEGLAQQRANQPGDIARRLDRTKNKVSDLLAVLAKGQPAGFPMDLMAPAGPPVDKLAPTGLDVDSLTLAEPPEGLAHQRANQPGDIARRPDRTGNKASDLLARLAKVQPAGFPMDSMALAGPPVDKLALTGL
jgi:hypothetical protein